MSSDPYFWDEELQFFLDPFPDFDTSIGLFQTISNTIPEKIQNHPIEDTNLHNSSIEKFPNPVISSSPPCYQLENLSLCQLNNFSNETTQVLGGFEYDGAEIKNEEYQVGHEYFCPHSYSGAENVAKNFQRSYSSNNCFHDEPIDNNNNNFIYQPSFNALMKSPDFQNHSLSSPENCFFGGHMRKVCSTGDLQNLGASQATSQRSFSRALATEGSPVDDGNFKVGRYSAEERKEKILKYRAKRTQRNFNKTIKYACRKTLADNRPRIRGRFARNEEAGELPKAACVPRDDEDDEFWLGLNEEDDFGRGRGGPFLTNYGQNQFQYYGY